VDNIKMNLRDIGWRGMDWIDLAQDRDQWRALVNTVMKLQVPQTFWKFLSSCTTGGLSRRAWLHEVSSVLQMKSYLLLISKCTLVEYLVILLNYLIV
jgi:hypothetical protein